MVGGILLVYILLAVGYSLLTPLFEAPDEYFHFAAILHIAQTGQLPPLELPPAAYETGPYPDYPWRQMAFHAPLYYMVASAMITGQDIWHFHDYHLNPHAQIGIGKASDNVNFIAHVPGNPTDSAVYTIRFFSVALGAITVAGVFWLGRSLLGQRWWSGLLPASLVAINPQFLFISGTINNDNLVTALSTLALLLFARMVQQPFSRRHVYLAALLLACAALSKVSGLLLYPLVMVVLLYGRWRWRLPWKRLLEYGLVILCAGLLIAGWWYARNWMSFGDFTGTTMVARATSPRSVPVTPGELAGLYFSFWGMFGWYNIQLPDLFYGLTLALTGGAVVGWVRFALTRPARQQATFVIALLMAFYVVLFSVSWWQFNTQVMAAQGRIWFPLLGPIALALAWGIGQLTRVLRAVAIFLIVLMAMTALIIPFAIIRPAYQPDPGQPAAPWSPPAEAVPFAVAEPWADEACLTLWAMPYERVDDSTLTLPLYLESHCPIEGYWSFYVHFVDLDRLRCVPGDTGGILSQTDSMPQGGNLPFPALQPGYVVRDTLSIKIPDIKPESGALHLGLYDASGNTPLRAPVSGPEQGAIKVGTCSSDYVMYSLN